MRLFLSRMKAVIVPIIMIMSSTVFVIPMSAGAEAYVTSKFEGQTFNLQNGRHTSDRNISAFAGGANGNNNTVFYYDGDNLHQVYQDSNSLMLSVKTSGNYIAWEARQAQAHTNQLYLYAISTGQITQVAAPAFDIWQLDLEGNHLAWNQDTTGTPATGEDYQQVFSYDIASGLTMQVTNDNFGNSDPQLTGSGLYWIGGTRANYRNIQRFNFQDGTTELIAGTTGPLPGALINGYYIQGNDVAWIQNDGSHPYSEVYWYDGTTTTQLTGNGQNNGTPVISGSGKYISWTQYPAHVVYQYDTGTGITTEFAANADNPMFNGSYEAWDQSPVGGGLPQIMLNNLSTGTTTQLTNQATQDQDTILAQNYILFCGAGCYVTKFSSSIITPQLTSDTNRTATYPTLSWDAVPFAVQYKVFRNGVVIGSVTDTSYSDTTVPEGSHAYYIQAVNNDVNSDYSNTIDVLVDRTNPVVSVTPVAGGTLSGVVTFNITITDNSVLDSNKNKSVWVYLYDTTGVQKSVGAKVNLSSGTGVFTVDTTKLNNGSANLDVGIIYDAVGNASGHTDNYFRNYVINN